MDDKPLASGKFWEVYSISDALQKAIAQEIVDVTEEAIGTCLRDGFLYLSETGNVGFHVFDADTEFDQESNLLEIIETHILGKKEAMRIWRALFVQAIQDIDDCFDTLGESNES